MSSITHRSGKPGDDWDVRPTVQARSPHGFGRRHPRHPIMDRDHSTLLEEPCQKRDIETARSRKEAHSSSKSIAGREDSDRLEWGDVIGDDQHWSVAHQVLTSHDSEVDHCVNEEIDS